MGLKLKQDSTSYAFDLVGREHGIKGRVTDWADVQQTIFAGPDKGKPDYWDAEKTRPKMMHRVVLETDRRTEENTKGVWSVYLKGSAKAESGSTLAAVILALANAGAEEIEENGTLELWRTGSRPGEGGQAYTYEAVYTKPGLAVGPTPPAPTAPVAAPVPPPPPAPVAAPAPPPPPIAAATTPEGYTLASLVAAGWTAEQAVAAYPMLAQAASPAPPAAPGGLSPEQAAALAGLTPEERALLGR